MNEYLLDPDVCPSSLGEDDTPMIEGQTAHIWDESTRPITCAECGAIMDDKVKAKIIELVPDVDAAFRVSSMGESITLADVLRAISMAGNEDLSIRTTGDFVQWGTNDGPQWNLAADYDGQALEVRDFIGSLLGV